MNHRQFAVLVGTLVLAAVVLLAAGPGKSRETPAVEPITRNITVTGEAEISAPADFTQITFTVRTIETSAAKAEVSNTASSARVHNALVLAGADADWIKPSSITVEGVSFTDYMGRESISGYRAESHVTLTLKGAGAAPQPFVDAGLATGFVTMQPVAYGITDGESLKQDAVRQALDNAAERASVVVSAAGGTLGELVAVDARVAEGPLRASTPDGIRVRATATVTYRDIR